MLLTIPEEYTNSYSSVNAKPYSTDSNAQTHNSPMEFRDWLQAQIAEIGIDPTALSRLEEGLNQPTIQRVLSGETPNPRLKTTEKIKEAVRKARQMAGLSPLPDSQAALKPAESAPQLINLSEHPDLKAVPRVRFKLSAGVSGYSVEPEDGNSKPVFFRKDWFEMHNYKPEKLFAVRVTGASMEPALWDSDLVVINTADTTPHDGDVFAMNYEGELVIKRMRRDAGEWWACSDNADQRRFAPKRCTDEVKIIGRVIYKQSERI